MSYKMILVISLCFISVYGRYQFSQEIVEDVNAEILAQIVAANSFHEHGWFQIMTCGPLSDIFYSKLQTISNAFVVNTNDQENQYFEDVVKYNANFIILSCNDFASFEQSFRKAMLSPYWHPKSKTIVYFSGPIDVQTEAEIFFIFYYYRVLNAILVYTDDKSSSIAISYYTPYVSEYIQIKYKYGCWTKKLMSKRISSFKSGVICENGCHNVTYDSQLRTIRLGTCIGFETITIQQNDTTNISNFVIFENKGINLHGFKFRAYIVEGPPFMQATQNKDMSYSLSKRDGWFWIEMEKRLNFTIGIFSNASIKYDFETATRQIFEMAHRKVDLILAPIYLMDVIVVELDMTIPFKDSGVCILAHKANYETFLFDVKLIIENYDVLAKYLLCFVFSWIAFSLYSLSENGEFSIDQVGKDLVNTFRIILSISLFKQPKKQAFRIFLATSIWSFFVINFATQAAIISFFSVAKRGKDFNTFEDIVSNDYPIEGISSPDVILPDDEKIFQKINSKLRPVPNMFVCVENMKNDSRRFCLMDCSVGRYFVRNKLNNKGELFLHMIQDQIHNHYLSFILQKHSPLLDPINKYLLALVESGIVMKWEQYRLDVRKTEVPFKTLSLDDLFGIFQCYFLLVAFCFCVFIVEVFSDLLKRFVLLILKKIEYWKRVRCIKKAIEFERKTRKVNFSHDSTQADN